MLGDDGIYVQPRKTQDTTGNKMVYSWTPTLRDAVENAKKERSVDISPFLFCKRNGESYVDEIGEYSGWSSSWQRFMKRVMTETKVTERFTSHDIRAKNASDAKTSVHAQEMLGHADAKITERVYRRKIKLVEPLR